jgi:RNA recognition motif-containing protein
LQAEQAIEEGRRLYVGNMPYHATTKDVEKLFEDVLNGVQAINIAVDPMTGRNPSYCFVDFTTKEMAERVMDEYDGRDFMRRPLKVKPGVRSGNLTGRRGKLLRYPISCIFREKKSSLVLFLHGLGSLSLWHPHSTPRLSERAKIGRR